MWLRRSLDRVLQVRKLAVGAAPRGFAHVRHESDLPGALDLAQPLVSGGDRSRQESLFLTMGLLLLHGIPHKQGRRLCCFYLPCILLEYTWTATKEDLSPWFQVVRS
jgi:hypothetical protein